MIAPTFRTLLCVAALSVSGAASPQESDADADTGGDSIGAVPTRLQSCFNVAGYRDMNVISDQHVYVRTRENNHYLVTTELCKNMQRSYRRGTARLVPYGSTVCQSDGSYFLYDAGGRELACPILSVYRVSGRAEAKSISEGEIPVVEVEEVEETAPAE